MKLHITQWHGPHVAVAFVVSSYTAGLPGLTLQSQRGRTLKMLVIDLPTGMKVGVVFKHDIFRKRETRNGREVWVPAPKLDPKTSDVPFTGISWCEIYKLRGNEADLFSAGWAICKVPDIFSKPIGRKRSLQHALAKRMPGIVKDPPMMFTRDDRATIWTEYWKWLQPAVVAQQPPTPVTPIPMLDPVADVNGNLMIGGLN